MQQAYERPSGIDGCSVALTPASPSAERATRLENDGFREFLAAQA